MISTYEAAPDIDVLTTPFPIPGLGLLAINAFVLHGAEPILVDTGPGVMRDDFHAALRTVIDPSSLRWLWLTHPDPDHTGALARLLEENPDLHVATNFLTVGMLSLVAPLPMDRVHLLNPGQSIQIGERTLTAFRPPTFDNPATLGFYEQKSKALFSSDCFGALLASVPNDAGAIPEAELRQAQITWTGVDAPWIHGVRHERFAEDVARVSSIEPRLVLSSHLPAAPGSMLGRLVSALEASVDAPPFVAPDQPALEQLLAKAAPPPATASRAGAS